MKNTDNMSRTEEQIEKNRAYVDETKKRIYTTARQNNMYAALVIHWDPLIKALEYTVGYFEEVYEARTWGEQKDLIYKQINQNSDICPYEIYYSWDDPLFY